jgi:hypothetical protein
MGWFSSKDAEAGQIEAAGRAAIDAASATIEKASQDLAKYNNPTDVLAHIEGNKEGIQRVKDLSDMLDKAKGKTARDEAKKKLKDAIGDLQGHDKDLRQKPKDKKKKTTQPDGGS